MVNRIIAEYLGSNKRLIIPEFGAFIKKDGEDNIVFVPFLKKDDGVLTEKITTSYGLTSAEAKAVIDDYIFNLRKAVSDNGFFAIESIGRIKTDDNNIYFLEYNTQEKTTGGATGFKKPDAQQKAVPEQPRVAEAPKPHVVPAQSDRIRNDEPAARVQQDSLAKASPLQQSRPAQPAQTERVAPQQRPGATDTGSATNQHLSALGQQRAPQRPAEEAYRQKQPKRATPPQQRRPQNPKQKADTVMIIAIIAALLAIGSILFSVVTNNSRERKVEVILTPDSTATNGTELPANANAPQQ